MLSAVLDLPGQLAAEYRVGQSPVSMASADVDHDGAIDAITVNSTTVSVGRNQGDGSFHTPVSYTVGTNLTCVVTADLNGDTWADLVVTDKGNGNVAVLMNLADGTFASAVTYAIPNSPSSVTVADVNGDNKPDLVTADSAAASVSVLLNLGNGAFAARTDYPTLGPSTSITTADVDGDGALEIITAGYRLNSTQTYYINKVSVLKNRGDGSFDADVEYSVGNNPTSVAAGDFDHDGSIDLVAANLNGKTLSVLRNLGDGTFASQVEYPTNTRPTSVKAADIDADGFIDLVASTDGNDVVLRNVGDGTFGMPDIYAGGGSSIEVADVNADGKLDLLTTAGFLLVLHNIGDGQFEAASNDLIYIQPRPGGLFSGLTQAITTADVDRDGRPDIITTDSNANSVVILRYLGDERFENSGINWSVGSYPFGVVAEDFNHDGAVDIATANNSGNTVSVLRNLGTGSFASQVEYSVSSGARWIVSADFDGDGSPDLATANPTSKTISVLRNAGDGTFLAQTSYTLTSSPGRLVARDYDHDGAVDLVMPGFNNILVMRNLGNGTFADPLTFPANNELFSSTDIDNDGANDLVATNYLQGTVLVQRNLGNGALADPVSYEAGYAPSAYASADFNADGAVDLVALGPGAVALLWNQGDGTFSRRARYAVGDNPRSLVALDVDKDGDQDLISCNVGNISVLTNNGNGTFTASPSGLGGGEFITTADLDQDGNVDLITAAFFAGSVLVNRNSANGTFADAVSFPAGSHPTCVATADVDHDGALDIVSVSQEGVVSVLRNLGNLTFAGQVQYTVASGSYGIAVGDIDGDGAVDIVTANRAANGSVSILRNLGNGTFATAINVAAGNFPKSLTVADVDHDGKTDIIVANTGIGDVYPSTIPSSISVLRNLGNMSFATETINGVGNSPLSVTATDYDSDGNVDLITANNWRHTVSILRGRGDGTFEPHLVYRVNDWPVSALIADLNNDGAMDVAAVSSNYGQGSVSILRNRAEGSSAQAADLQVTAVTAQPDPSSLGGALHVEYTVTNSGPVAAEGRWIDSIFLSRNDQAGSSDHLLTRVLHEGGLASNSSYSNSLDLDVEAFAGFTSGDWFVLVKTDSGSDVAEQSNANNVGNVETTINQSITALTLGTPFTGTLSAGEERYFQVNYSAGNQTVFVLDGLPADGTVEVYIKRDGLPTQAVSDYSRVTPFATEQFLLAPPQATSGTYYILIHAATLSSPSTSFRLTASVPEFGVRTTRFGTAGNAGDFTLRALGAGFDNSIIVRLKSGLGFDLPATRYSRDSDNTLFATFDLRGVTPGQYDVVFTNGNGGVVGVPHSLTVVAASEPAAVVPNVIVPQSVRRNREFGFTVEWVNKSLNDVIVPLLTIGSTSPFGAARGDYALGDDYTFLGISSQGGPAGILRPGQRESRTFWSFSGPEEGAYSIFADRVSKDQQAPFDWNSLKSDLIPPGVTEEEFEPVFQQLVAQVGPTWADYLAMLSRNATLLPAKLGGPSDPANLNALELTKARAAVTNSITGHLVLDSDGILGGDFEVGVINQTDNSRYSTLVLNDGSFIFTDLTPGQYTFMAPGYRVNGLPVGGIAVAVNDHITGLELHISRGLGLSFDLSSQTNHAPVENAFITMYNGTTAISAGMTDDAGQSTMTGLDNATLNAVIDADGYARTWLSNLTPNLAVSLQHIELAPESVLRIHATRPDGSPATDVLFQATRRDTAVGADFFASAAGTDLAQANGLASGTYDLSIAAPGMIPQTFAGIVLGVGEIKDLGTIQFEAAPAPAPGSLSPASAIIDATLAAMLAALEDTVRVRFLLLPAARGFEFTNIALAFLDNSPYHIPLYTFRDGSSTVEGNRRWTDNPGFRNHVAAILNLRNVYGAAVDEIEHRITTGQIVATDLCGPEGDRELVFDFFNLLADTAPFLLYVSGNLPGPNPTGWDFAGTLAGGLGHGGTPGMELIPDYRHIEGEMVVSVAGTNRVRVEARNVQFTVGDTFDFIPGNLGPGLLPGLITLDLRTLEYFGEAYDIGLKIEWNHHGGLPPQFLDLNGAHCCDGHCDPCRSENPPDSCGDIDRPASRDPNDIVGPAGEGAFNSIDRDSTMPYIIHFENDATHATAPAAEVTITQTLDSDLDWTTFRLGDIGFGDTIVEVPADTAFFQTQVDLTDTRGVLVNISAGINIATGEVHWEFTAIDPTTGDLPENPLVGFLPPNVTGPEGEGFVNYTVRPKASLVTPDRIDAAASIVFDVNDPLLTPAIFHTIDSGVPASHVVALPTVTDTLTFTVTWEGADDTGGAGIENYDVFVSDNGGPYVLFLDNTTATSAEFTGQSNHTYGFYSVATDLLGHHEAAPSIGDTQTTIVSSPELAITGQEITWHNGQSPVAGLPDIVVNGQDLTGGVLRLNTTAVGSRKKAKDVFVFGTVTPWGTSSGPTYANGHVQVEIQLNSAATAPLIQAFLRSITFSTKGKGTKVSTRNLTVTLENASGQTASVSRTLHVVRTKGRALLGT